MVKEIARPIIKASGLTQLDWEFMVVDKDVANAFVLPGIILFILFINMHLLINQCARYLGGKVCVFTGIMKLATSKDELATVLSHEIGHVVASTKNYFFHLLTSICVS